MTDLKPSFWRVAVHVTFSVLGVYLIWFLYQGFSGHWPNPTDFETLVVIGLPVITLFVWLAFVPRRFAFSDHEITIQSILGAYTYRWPMLDSYGPGRGVFMIQFDGDRQAYQIYSGAYPKAEWAKFLAFLDERFPERRTSFSIGGRLIRK